MAMRREHGVAAARTHRMWRLCGAWGRALTVLVSQWKQQQQYHVVQQLARTTLHYRKHTTVLCTAIRLLFGFDLMGTAQAQVPASKNYTVNSVYGTIG